MTISDKARSDFAKWSQDAAKALAKKQNVGRRKMTAEEIKLSKARREASNSGENISISSRPDLYTKKRVKANKKARVKAGLPSVDNSQSSVSIVSAELAKETKGARQANSRER